jgi:uncharacterized repeat protein (TIGR03803 family)
MDGLFHSGECLLKYFVPVLLFVPIINADAAQAKTETVLYSFQNNGADANLPVAGLINVKGTLYGTTQYGGASDVGAVYAINPSTGSEKVLHSFQNNGSDGYSPEAGLINVDGVLYGTTVSGGASGVGTVFSIDPATGAERVVYAFKNDGTDGNGPFASLIDVNGTLYGTTAGGGTGPGEAGPGGTVFSLNLSTGAESVLYSFVTENGEGYSPVAGLTYVDGILYGTASLGGLYNGGTVFSIDPSTGAFSTLYEFGQHSGDGNDPQGNMIDVHGTLYGTTFAGGTGVACSGSQSGCGTVFSINPTTGAESVLYSFHKVVTDGSGPLAGVIDVKGTLYGTTEQGGGSSDAGTVFAVNPSTGAESVLYSFKKKGGDGIYPFDSLIDFRGALYGTTSNGGAQSVGTVFKIKP